jgi:hypothetical protein
MTTIIAGGFDHISRSEEAMRRLREAGVSEDDLCEFRVNPAGEHHATALGGDRDKSPGNITTEDGATKGAAIGAAIGVAAGAAATPFMGPAAIAAGAGVGGYTGSLLGSLGRENREPQPDRTYVRPAESLVAVNIGGGNVGGDDVVRIFEECGARQVERAEGLWQDGEWKDFDPVGPPNLVGGRDLREAREGRA